MERTVGTTSRGIRTPIIKAGDNLVEIVVNSLLNSAKNEGFEIKDRDVLGITESLLARAQGNYIKNEVITKDINNKFPGDIGIVFPILSRNRFAPILKSIADSGKKITLLLSYPADEVGNHLMREEDMYKSNLNPWTDSLTEEEYRDLFGPYVPHPFTGIDYVDYYKNLGQGNIEIIFSNNPEAILEHSKDVLVANVHNRKRTEEVLKKADSNIVLGLDELVNEPIDGSACNPKYGLLGANLATEDEIKLFPRDSQKFVEDVQSRLKEETGKTVEVMIYGDGAFKDPVGQIWELADPVVSPGWTSGLIGTPEEVKLKYIVDSEMGDLKGNEVENAIREKINSSEKKADTSDSLGTTPRRLTDLLGTLCDLTSGSGDKGTPVVHIQGYFDNYASK